MRSEEDIIQLLVKHGINPTQQRLQIALALLSQEQHATADSLLAMLNAQQQVVSKATVYNTLGLFVEKKLVRALMIDPNKIVYDSNTSNHYHFYNEDNGELSDIDPQAISLEQLPELPKGTYAEGIDIIIRVRHQNSE